MSFILSIIVFVLSPLLLIADVTIWHNVYLYIAPMVSNSGALFLTVVSSLVTKGIMVALVASECDK